MGGNPMGGYSHGVDRVIRCVGNGTEVEGSPPVHHNQPPEALPLPLPLAHRVNNVMEEEGPAATAQHVEVVHNSLEGGCWTLNDQRGRGARELLRCDSPRSPSPLITLTTRITRITLITPSTLIILSVLITLITLITLSALEAAAPRRPSCAPRRTHRGRNARRR